MADIVGIENDDQLDGSFEPDEIHGDMGDDTIYGHGDDDDLYGEEGADYIYGGAGNDNIYGGEDDDADTLYGDSGSDSIYAGGGDTVFGRGEKSGEAPDEDALYVDNLDHICNLQPDAKGNGYDGQNVLDDGGIVNFTNIGVLYVNGVETPWPDFIVEGNDGSDSIDANYEGDPEGDKIDNQDNENCNNDDLVEAYGGDDKVSSGDGNDTVYAGSGDDGVKAGEGIDTVYGEDGDDYLHGNQGNGILDGGQGSDQIYGRDGRDDISGGDGNDSAHGGAGSDRIYGDAGNHQVYGGEDGDSFCSLDANLSTRCKNRNEHTTDNRVRPLPQRHRKVIIGSVSRNSYGRRFASLFPQPTWSRT